MATAIDSTGVRVDGEENGENERAGERTTADGRRGGQGCLAEEERERGGILGRERARERDRESERESENKKGLRRERGARLGQDPGAGDECSVEIDRGHGVTMVVLHGTPFIRYNAG